MGIDDILADPSASDWLKQALRSALCRDCVDTANDAEALAERINHATTSLAEGVGPHRQGRKGTIHA